MTGQDRRSTMEDMMWTNGMDWWMWLLMAAATLGFWVVVVFAVKALLGPSSRDEPRGEDPMRVLDARLARGDIEPEEYFRIKRALTDDR